MAWFQLVASFPISSTSLPVCGGSHRMKMRLWLVDKTIKSWSHKVKTGDWINVSFISLHSFLLLCVFILNLYVRLDCQMFSCKYRWIGYLFQGQTLLLKLHDTLHSQTHHRPMWELQHSDNTLLQNPDWDLFPLKTWHSTEGNGCIWPHTSLWVPGPCPPPGQHELLKQAWASCPPIPSKACVTGAFCSCSSPPLQNLSQVCHLVILIGAVTLLAPSQFLFQILCHGMLPFSDLSCSWQTPYQ